MLDLLELNETEQQEQRESCSETPDEVEFACVYFTYYPYLYTTN